MRLAVISMIREGWGGSEELWAALATYALSQGDAVAHSYLDVVAQSPKKGSLKQQGLVEFPRSGIVEPGLTPPVRWVKKLLLFLRNSICNPYSGLIHWQPDVILYNGTCFSVAEDRYLLSALERTRAAFVYIGHYCGEQVIPMSTADRNRIKKYYDRASLIYTSSERNRIMAARQLEMDLSHLHILRNPVNMPATDPIPFPSNTQAQLAMVANLRMVHKGQDLALRALAGEKWRGRDWQLNIYGKGEDRAKILQLTHELGLEERVDFHGVANNIRDIWSRNQLLLMPSRMEGMPLAVVEAMLCGRPSVLTDVGGHAEWVEHHQEGWIAASVTVKGFEEALEAAWQARDQWAVVGAQAHEKAMRFYDPHPGKTLYETINELLKP